MELNNSKKNAIIIDIDGTLANCDHRKHYVSGEKKDWNSFFSEISGDSLNIWCREIIERFFMHDESGKDYKILLLTGRSEDHEDETHFWLSKHDIYSDYIYCRKRNDYREDSIVKKEIYIEKIKPYYQILFAIEDRSSVVKMWRDLGIVCLQCAAGNF